MQTSPQLVSRRFKQKNIPVHPKTTNAKHTQLINVIVIQIAGFDPLRDEGFAYGEALRAAGVPVTEKVFAGLPHAFYFFLKALDKESREYFQNIVDYVNDIEKKSIPI